MAARRGPTSRVRSTFIVGFPGETDAEFDELLAFLDAAQLDRVGCFAYSPVDGAAANALPDPVRRRRRRSAARALHGGAGAHQRDAARRQGRPHARRARRRGGATASAIGRSAADAPEIDGVVRIEDGAALTPGAFARVTIAHAEAHDLSGRLAR